ncbi:PAAR-like protein [Paenibacillus sp. MMS18-CY102]|uniref:PAAR-like protein n=1 Tax=Paenibacillus sp. MMS18-CY102 TaxID=2682849 RepID=UPI001366293C|nr:PAAR-like protein [Paenibacillus sp. MMS18-CY102]MWC31384.1 DUF4280 domain-containing protein [Paenibacillus sp. MMS18-CY102]
MGVQDTLLQKGTRESLQQSPWRSEDTYVTAGAFMCCSMGTHEEVLNKLDPNGIYINGSPMLTVNDCAVSSSEAGVIKQNFAETTFPVNRMGQEIDGNFYSFGFCRSVVHPMKMAEGAYPGMAADSSYIFDPDQSEPTFSKFIYPCAPKLLPTVSPSAPSGAPFKKADTSNGPFGLPSLSFSDVLANFNLPQTQWTNGSPSVSIQGVPALTSKSCLFCQYGGKIQLLTNGMDPAPPEFSAR